MVRTVSLAVFLMLSWVPFCQGKDEDGPSYYKLTPLTQNPGIYYEYMGEVKIERVKWRIVVTLDFSKWKDPTTWREKQIFQMITTCNSQLSKQECNEFIPVDKFELAIKSLKSLQEDLHIFFAPLLVIPDDSFTPYTHTLAKRWAPFEFVGWTSRQLFGTMDAEDREQLNQDVDGLYERTANISTLVASQTHIVKSNLESLHEKLNDAQGTLHEQHIQFLRLANRTNQLNFFVNRTATVQALLKWVYQFDQSLEHSINSYKTLVNAIETATQGHLHPLLFTHEQLQSILKTINGHTLPWEHSTVTVEMLHAMSKISVSTVRGKLVLTLEFPLSDKARYSQYKIHPLPIPQDIMTNSTSYVMLVPQYSHLIVSHDMQNYVLATKEYINTCKIYQKISMCPPSLPFNIDNENSPCEFALLARPTPATLRTCKLAISAKPTPYWSRLSSTDEWLYSVIKPVQMRIMCNEERKAEVIISGTGILTLRGQCYGHTSQNILYGVNILQTNETFLYNPGLKLNLTFTIDSIMKGYDSFDEIPDISNEEKQQIRKWAESEDAITLQQLEDKFTEIAAQKREKIMYTSYIFSAVISPLIIIALIIIIYKYCCLTARCSCCIRKSKKSNKKKTKTAEKITDETLELPTVRPLVAYDSRNLPCNVEEITTNFNAPRSPAAESVVLIPPTKIRNCTQLAVYQSQEASGSNHQLGERGRISSVDSSNYSIRPLPIQGSSLY